MYNNSRKKIESLLDLWKVIEILTPSPSDNLKLYLKDREELEKLGLRKKEYRIKKETLYLFEDIYQVMNYTPGEDEENEIWWKVYIGAINWKMAEESIHKRITELFGKDESEGLIRRNNNLIVPSLGFMMNNNTGVVEKSITLSTAAWALGKITSNDFNDNQVAKLMDFESDFLNIKQEILSKCFSENNLKKALKLKEVVAELLGVQEKYFVKSCNICVRKIVKKPKKLLKEKLSKEEAKCPDLDIFNSFFLDEIQNVKNNIGSFEIGSAISKYLGQSEKPDTYDVLNDGNSLNELIYSTKVCSARWPFSPQKSAALLQAASANSILKKDRDAKLFAINGPPGTGKTTMMFDIIANIYVERAEQLAKLNSPKKAFVNKKTYEAENFQHHIFELIPSLQGFEIIVASSNNAAVENISKEMNLLSNTDSNFYQKIDYYKWLNGDEDEGGDEDKKDKNKSKHWGLFAAVLGNKFNKNKFIEKVWKEEYIPTQEGDKNPTSPKTYKYQTMFQYLNMIKNFGDNKFFQYCSDKFKIRTPKYIANEKSLMSEWEKVCNSFNKKLNYIKDIQQQFLKLARLKSQKYKLEKDNEKYASSIKSKIGKNRWLLILNPSIFFYWLYYTIKIKFNNKDIKIIENNITTVTFVPDKIEGGQNSYATRLKRIYQDFNKNLDLYNKGGEEKNMMAPYSSIELENLKNNLFIDAVKLHKMVVDGNPIIFSSILTAFKDILQNRATLNKPEGYNDFFKKVWQGLFMFMPVVSTTFHSYGSLFKNFKKDKLGWLIIDEAGQVLPQYSVGAIYRSNNVIVVGDPEQTEPISIVGKKLINKLFDKFSINSEHWSPTYVSTQNIADRNSLYRTKYENCIIGFPLLVHRRCNKPMFTICNELSYNGRMIYATNKKDNDGILDILGKSQWIDVSDNHPKEKLSVAEYKKLQEKLLLIIDKKGLEYLKNIFVITLFKVFAGYIRRNIGGDINECLPSSVALEKSNTLKILNKWANNNIGTVHTFQGKENDIIFFLLGAQRKGNLDCQGYAEPLLKKPNVLNVAMSRAKIATYIIGDKKNMTDRFDYLAKIKSHLG